MKKSNQESTISISIIAICFLISFSFYTTASSQECSQKKATVSCNKMNKAATSGNIELMKKLIEEDGYDVNTRLPNKQTALIQSAYDNHIELAKYLLDKGADVTLQNEWAMNALDAASQKGNLEIVKLLVENGANVNSKGCWGFTPLHWSTRSNNPEVCKFLLKNGANVSTLDDYGRPAILIASWNGNPEIFRALIENGANVNAKTKENNTALHNAARNGQLETIKILLGNNADANFADNNQMLPIHLAAQNRHSSAIELLATKTQNINTPESIYQNTVLNIAAINGDVASTKVLLKAGADANIENSNQLTPLENAIKYGHVNLVDLYITQDIATKADKDLALKNIKMAFQPVSLGEARVNYTGHSGWIVQTSDKVLVFDYWANNKPKQLCLANGSFCPEEMKDKEVYVFVSHNHGDHYDTVIYSWAKDVKNIQYVYGFNPNSKEANSETAYTGPKYTYIADNTTKKIKDVSISTLKSNDTGQGFLIETDGVSIYHPGDHAWFSSEDEEIFKKEVDYIETVNNNVDIAFLGVTGCPGRWKKEYIVNGFNYSIEKLNPKVVYPMHAFQREHLLKEFEELAVKNNGATNIVSAENKGDNYLYNSNNMAKK